MSKKNLERVLNTIDEEEVQFVLLQFTDILGIVKNVTIPATRFEHAIEDGVAFDGSSILGYAPIEESDLRTEPQLDTFKVLPWTNGKVKSAGIVCKIYDPDGRRHSGDPRYVLEKMMAKARKKGWILNTGPEYEFFLFRMDENGNPTRNPSDSGGYFDLLPMDEGDIIRKESTHHLNALGYNVEASHHEVAPGQHELDLKYTDAVSSADRVMTLKPGLKTVAREHNLHCTFMPKPIRGINGSGMHVHQSLITPDGENVFYDEKAEDGLSDLCKWFIGGSLKYARETCGVLASWVNSYKRLVPGFEAPVYISWAHKNRSALIRLPPGRGMKTRVEVRNPDPAGNPYLQFAVMLAAGLKGIEEKIEPPSPVEKDIFQLTEAQREQYDISPLPGNLAEALDEMEASKLVKETLGPHIMSHFTYIKRQEWDDYKRQVTGWEVDRYLSTL
ncbi:MAG: type I glutamate--ammonia ligase [Thermoplasmata archaeon]